MKVNFLNSITEIKLSAYTILFFNKEERMSHGQKCLENAELNKHTQISLLQGFSEPLIF